MCHCFAEAVLLREVAAALLLRSSGTLCGYTLPGVKSGLAAGQAEHAAVGRCHVEPAAGGNQTVEQWQPAGV